jgi:hypothetical protein
VLLNQGSGDYSQETVYATQAFSSYPVLADVDADGDVDVVLPAGAMLLNDGTGALGAPQRFPTGVGSLAGDAGDVDQDGDLDLAVTNRYSVLAGAPAAIEVLRNEATSGTVFCPGDGSDGACPCGNSGAPGHGCANLFFADGGALAGSGVASVVHDRVLLRATNVTGPACVFFQGSASTPAVVIDDGLGCVAGSIVRLGTRPVSASSAAYPGAGDPRIALRGMIPAAGTTRFYQGFYRNAASSFCPPAGSNRTNGFVLVWTP